MSQPTFGIWSANTIILQAEDRDKAYEKAVRMAEENVVDSEFSGSDEDAGRKGLWVLAGLTLLMAIYDKLEDGAEVLRREHPDATLDELRRRLKKKHKLETFDDAPGLGDS